MRKLLSLIFILSAFYSSGQVKFEKMPLSDAVKKAGITGKIILAQFVVATCDQCNEVADIAFSEKELGDAVAKKFIPLRIDLSSQDREEFIQKYNPSQSMGTYFISGDGELVHRYPATTTRVSEYIIQLDKASANLVEGKATLAELNSEWSNNPVNIAAMEANLERRFSIGFSTDSLLDVYVNRLPVDSFQSIRTLAFIAKLAPTLFSKSNLILKKDRELYRKAWYLLPLTQRVSINNKVAYKSMSIAIAEKDFSKANYVANAHASTYGEINSKSAQKVLNKKMLDYFIGVKDTSGYLKQAVIYYEKFYLGESDEAIQKLDSIAKSKAMLTAKSEPLTPIDRSKGMVSKSSFSYSPITQFFSNDLNVGAWLLYTSSSDKIYLDKALAWVKRANEVHESPDALDTYARLLYKSGDRLKAIELEEKALEFSREKKLTVKRFEEVLLKMKAGNAIID